MPGSNFSDGELGRHEGTPYTLLEFLTNLFKDRLWLALAFLVPMAAAGFLALRAKPSYEARASLVVRVGREHIYQPEVGELGTQPIAIAREQALRSELNILTSRDLLAKVVTKFGPFRLIPELARRRLPPAAQSPADVALLQVQDSLNAVLVKDSSIIEVSFRHANPQLAADVVNQLIADYLLKRVDVLSDRRASFMHSEVGSNRERLAATEKRIDDFKREHEIVSYERQREMLLEQRTTLEGRLREVTARLAEVKGRLEVIQPPAGDQPGTEVRDDGFRLGAVRDLVATEGVKLQAEKRSAEAIKQVLQQQVAEIGARLRRFTQNESELQQMLREKQMLEGGYQTNSKRLEDARIMEDLDKRAKNTVSIVQAATPPLKKKRTRVLILGVGGAVSLVSMLLVGFLCDLFRNVYLLPDQLRRSVDLPVLVSFPRARRR